MHTVGRILTGAAVATMAVASGCGSDEEDSGPSASDADVTVEAKDTLEFDRDAYTVPAGEIVVAYEDVGSMTHTLLVEDVDDFELRVTGEGNVDTGTVELEPGEYRFYCDIPGHESMEATLTVE